MDKSIIERRRRRSPLSGAHSRVHALSASLRRARRSAMCDKFIWCYNWRSSLAAAAAAVAHARTHASTGVANCCTYTRGPRASGFACRTELLHVNLRFHSHFKTHSILINPRGCASKISMRKHCMRRGVFTASRIELRRRRRRRVYECVAHTSIRGSFAWSFCSSGRRHATNRHRTKNPSQPCANFACS